MQFLKYPDEPPLKRSVYYRRLDDGLPVARIVSVSEGRQLLIHLGSLSMLWRMQEKNFGGFLVGGPAS